MMYVVVKGFPSQAGEILITRTGDIEASHVGRHALSKCEGRIMGNN